MKIRLLILFVLILNSCATAYKINVEETVKVKDYDIYVFRLCEKTNKLGNERFFLCDVDCKTRLKALEVEKTIVSEELYLLVSRTTDDVIYLSTKTNRSFDKTPDIFNTEAHEDYVLVNDLENVYFGKMKTDFIVFENKDETLIFNIEPNTRSCKLSFDRIKSRVKKISQDKPLDVVISNIYNVPFAFNLTKRTLAIKVKNTTIYDLVDTIELNKTKVRFNGGVSFIEGSKRRRLKYHPDFDTE